MENRAEMEVKCHNEYHALKSVIVVPPDYMAITEVINETQNYYANDNINTKIATEQHQAFVSALQTQDATVHELNPESDLNEQVFTRDIGFTIGEKLFVCNMARDIRKKEVKVLVDWLEENGVSYTQCEVPSIEGGDVIIDGKQIWVGLSGRTTLAAVQALQTELPNYTISPIELRDDILHLDCVLNVIGKDTALIYPEALTKADYERLKQHYKLITITKEEQFAMGPNVLAVNEGKLISLPENKRINKELTKAGFEVIEVPFSEIIKSGGSFRCCTLPLLRK